MQPSIADENTRQHIIMKYIPRVFVKEDNKKCRSAVNEQKFRNVNNNKFIEREGTKVSNALECRKFGSCYSRFLYYL